MAGILDSIFRRSKKRQRVSKNASLRKINASKVTIFKIQNRGGYAAICMNNLTEGKTPQEAFRRLIHPLRRMGFELADEPSKVR